MKISVCGFSSRVIALAAALGLSLSGLHRAQAAPTPVVADDGPSLTLLSPTPRASFSGVKPIEISAFYQSNAKNGIVGLELYIDGVKAQAKTLDTPESKGIVSFLVDASLLTPGPHQVVVRATAVDAEVRSAKGAFTYASDELARPDVTEATPNAGSAPEDAAPGLRLVTPTPGSKVQGTVAIRAAATDAGGKTPYVSIFVDGEFKTLVNYRPFEYEWDTTALPNGWHTIAATEAFDADGQAVTHLKPIRVYVNNPGGETSIRHDLQDGVQPASVKVIAPRKTLAPRPLARRPTGPALLAVPTLTAHTPKAPPVQMAKADTPWDDLRLNLDPGLSDPFVPELPAPTVEKAVTPPATPLAGFKPVTVKPLSAPVLTSALPGGKQSRPTPAHAARLLRMAKAGTLLDESLSSVFLSLPRLPAALPHTLNVSTAHPAMQPHLMRLALHMPHIQVHLPQLHLTAPSATVKPHVALHAGGLLSSVGQTQVLFNTTKLQLDRPLAAQQNVVFGPLRQIFEYGGGSLQWNARTGLVRAQSDGKDIRLTIGQTRATVNAKPVTLTNAPYLSAGRTMIPLSFLPAAMDVTVQYDPATGHLRITSKN